VLLNVLAAVALGALLQNSAAAIAACFALPAAFAVLGTASTLVSEWMDMSTPWNWVLENDWDVHVPQISFSTRSGLVDRDPSVIAELSSGSYNRAEWGRISSDEIEALADSDANGPPPGRPPKKSPAKPTLPEP
jgi:hypothetical protein